MRPLFRLFFSSHSINTLSHRDNGFSRQRGHGSTSRFQIAVDQFQEVNYPQHAMNASTMQPRSKKAYPPSEKKYKVKVVHKHCPVEKPKPQEPQEPQVCSMTNTKPTSISLRRSAEQQSKESKQRNYTWMNNPVPSFNAIFFVPRLLKAHVLACGL